MTAIAMAVSLGLLMVFGDRLRQITWGTTKPIFVALYLSHMLWALSLVYESWIETFDLHDVAGVVAMVIFILITRINWLNGPPLSFRRNPAHQPQPDL